MKKYVMMLAFSINLLLTASSPNSFGPHDPFKTKGAFAEMRLNNTGTQTEIFARTAGLFAHLEVCSEQCKKYPELPTTVFETPNNVRNAVRGLIQNRYTLNAIPNQNTQKAMRLLDTIFAKTLKTFKGSNTYTLHPQVLIDGGKEQYAFAFPLDNKVFIAINLHQVLVPIEALLTQYYTLLQETNLIKTFHKKSTLEAIDATLTFQTSYLHAALLHELSHTTTLAMRPVITHKNPAGIKLNEEYTNTLAILNSPTPLETGFNLLQTYHSMHLPKLMKDLEKEDVTWTDTEIRKAAKRLFSLDNMLQSFAPDNNH